MFAHVLARTYTMRFSPSTAASMFMAGNAILIALALSLTACSHPQHGVGRAPKVLKTVDLKPNRPRYTYLDRPRSERLAISKVSIIVDDGRKIERRDSHEKPVLSDFTGEYAVEVSLHRTFLATLSLLLNSMIDHSKEAKPATLFVAVDALRAYRNEQSRGIYADLKTALIDGEGWVLARGSGTQALDLEGVPYDAEELDEMHRGALLESLDAAMDPRFVRTARDRIVLRDAAIAEANATVDRAEAAAPAPMESVSETSASPRTSPYDTAIRKVMTEDHLDEVLRCADRDRSSGRFSVQVRFQIGPNGAPQRVLHATGPHGHETFERCFFARFPHWSFPPTPSGNALFVSYPYVIEPDPSP